MKKTTFYYLIAFAMLSLIFIGCTSNEEQLKKLVEEANRTAYPKQLDEITWLDSLSVQPGLRVISHHRITEITKDDFTPEQIEMLKFELKIQTLKSIVESNDKYSKRFINAGVTFCMEYKDEDGNLITSVDITPEDYKNALK